MTVLEAIGGKRPLEVDEFAKRAHDYVRNPHRNPLKEIMDRASSFEETPPFLGIFNDIPLNKLREDEVHTWAKAGFSFVVNDAEHLQWEGWYGREQNAVELRLGVLPVQRLHREALSSHGDVFQLGARATMRPYCTSLQEAKDYFNSVKFPLPGKAHPYSRGGYPVRDGARNLLFTPDLLLGAETETQGWLQFETAELILNTHIRNAVLELMQSQGKNKACGFVGPFDAILREGDIPEIETAVNELFRAAAKRGIHMGRVVGSGSLTDPGKIEEAMRTAIENGARLICVHYLTSDLPLLGALHVSESFFRAVSRCGF
jgi:2-keto-3-deoxy-L-rhamnonate aldolase RhmA